MSVVRYDIQDQFRKLSKESVGLAWALAPQSGPGGEATLAEWGFASFGQWIAEDICNATDPKRCFVSRSYAYELASVGRIFYPYRAKVDELAQKNEMGIRRLIALSNMVQQGADIKLIEEHLYAGTPLPEEIEAKTAESDTEKLVPVRVLVRKGDYDNFQLSAFLHAVLNGHKTTDSAIVDVVLSDLPHLMSRNLGTYERFKPWILDGKFKCRLCGKIPHEPTVHHVIPKSVTHGYGPQVILCARPCHYDKVQPRWKRYAKLWGFDVDAIKAEADAMRAEHGCIINTGPYECYQPIEAGDEGDSQVAEASPIPHEAATEIGASGP